MTASISAATSRVPGLLVALAVAASACSPAAEITRERHPTRDFSRLASWAWARDAGIRIPAVRNAPFVEERLRAAIASELAARGYVEVPAANADMLVSYALLLTRADVTSFSDFLRYKSQGGKDKIMTSYTAGFSEGSLAIDVYDRVTAELIWRGTARHVYDPDGKGDRIAPAVAEILGTFPH